MAIKTFLYSADAPDQEPELAAIEIARLSDRELLWIDLATPTPEEVAAVAERIGCDPGLLRPAPGKSGRPRLANYGHQFRLTAAAVELPAQHQKAEARWVALVAGPNYVVSVHDDGIDFMDELRDRERGETGIGALSAESFVASLLDWLLNSYFQALEAIVRQIDMTEVSILGKRVAGTAPQIVEVLVQSRRRVAEVRRLLISHRDLLYGLSRPDFMATEKPETRPHFAALNSRLERAEDEADHTRELVIGAFELLSMRAAQRTNATMQVLTFVTVLLGSLALLAGVMGMNFELPFFQSGQRGFLIVTGAMVVGTVFSVLLAVWRKWI